MKRLIDILKDKTSYDFESYITRIQTFWNDDFNKLVSYWKNNSSVLEPQVLFNFQNLYNEYEVVISSFQKASSGEDYNIEYFDFVEYLSDIKMMLDSIKNLPKFLKTSSNFIDVFEEPVIEYFVSQGDTIESIAKKYYGDQEQFGFILDYNNLMYFDVNDSSWVGTKIKIPFRRTLKKDVKTVVDGLIGDDILGKDLDSSFVFSSNDLVTVSGESCLKKSVENLLSLEKGSIPENTNIGLMSKNIIGQGLGNLSYIMIVNDFENLMMNEETIDFTKIINIEFNEDSLNIDFSFTAINGKEYLEALPIKI